MEAALWPAAPQDLDLLDPLDGSVRARVRIAPVGALLVAHDPEEELGRDHVPGVGGASRTLAGLTVRRPVESALDLGTGCGIQALLAASHAGRVVATDVNPRALVFTGLNAALNGLTNVECREGSLFEPVLGEEFDLVVANPPFVVSPENAFVFRDSGEPGDEVSRRVVGQAAEHLREGGFAHILCNWIRRPGDEWSEVPRSWIEGQACDTWVLHYQTEDPLRYAAKWSDPFRNRSPDAEATLDRWLDYYKREGIEAIATGALILRRRTGRNWVRADEMPAGPSGSGGDHVLRVFAAEDYLQGLAAGRALLDDVFALVPGHRLDQTLVYEEGYVAGDARLRLAEGLGVVGLVPPNVLQVLFSLDGRRPLGEAISDAAAVTGVNADDALATVRRLFGLGFLERL